ncbi:PTS system, lactose/cellobiose family IIC component family protein [Enterococcus faecalis 62]|uniref:PTS sugar transporter subunit IIC n=1 Tax=Enterococcus faecalis TaxID=1351 RepID=UPI0001FFC138|nr:PTS transporter subunit EIIC [Enterococcus faecalis]ADX80421.1 PTS system, lactose/cellobiose family IIC component family protein [Enterococcus faecalis 62]EOJ62847.1 PTS system, lactose/cellobiose family IIC component [Enterococcus faecalis EnGen0350]MBE9440982.1 PTS sugar transporter subunit IIC [Enterococcus faecalis]MBE9443966.1 PTS sugar transporter subunit IIC [Enterococcus faecalis]MBE9449561.1 PTS sugar transporter subunit IIC [Enterococcus faecalis]
MSEKIMNTIQNKVLPIATKIGNQRFLVALRDSFMGTMPVIMTGSVAILLNAFLVDFPMQFGYEKITYYFQWLVDINNLISKGSISIVSLLFIYCLGVNIAKIYKTDTLSSGLVALSSFIISISNSMTSTYNLSNNNNIDLTTLFTDVEGITVTGNSLNVTISGLLPGTQINSNGYFTAIIIGFLSSIIFCKLMNKNWTIKLPDTVPPAIAKPFLSIIPALVSLYIIAILTFLLNRITGKILTDVIYEILQRPMLGLSQSFFVVILVAFLVQFFWFFGIHGGNVMAPIMEGVFGVALLVNLEAYQNNETIPYVWTSVSYGSFVWYATLGLLIAIFWVSKNSHYKEVAKLGIMPVLFNIGEPVMYGLPTVLNPILFIPFLLCPAVMSSVAYLVTDFKLGFSSNTKCNLGNTTGLIWILFDRI